MPHHLKGGGEKEGLTLALVGEPRHFAAACLIEHMANNQAKYDAPKPGTHDDGERNADDFTPILHILPG